MKIYLLVSLCLITRSCFALFVSPAKTQSSLVPLSFQIASYTSKILPGDSSSRSLPEQCIIKKKKKNKSRHFLHQILNKAGSAHTGDFSFGGLMLGMLLGPVGVAISYLTKNKKLCKWSVVGCLIDVGLGMLFILIAILAVTF